MWTVFGQEEVTSQLAVGIDKGLTHHAYLFTGPSRTGKKLTAYNLARAINCESSQAPCGECVSCERITGGKHADVQLIDLVTRQDETGARTAIVVEEIEAIQRAAILPPFEGRSRVFIIDGAEFLTAGAANRLLKTLEEPPPGVVFVLLAASFEQVLPTVASRCRHFEFKLSSNDSLAAYLVQVAGAGIEEACLLARLSRGRTGWAIEALKDGQFREDYFKRRDNMLALFVAGYEERFSWAGSLAMRFGKNRPDVHDELLELRIIARDLLLAGFGQEDYITNQDKLESINRISSLYKPGELVDFIKAIQAAGEQLSSNVNPRLVLENAVLSLKAPATGIMVK
ncbi:MAG: DNA polymerase III subunit delta' [Dehalococcoidaceae bacterium]|nr:DNA polymerase III subunit delta' [Dehalococcoidaceae bacterium]